MSQDTKQLPRVFRVTFENGYTTTWVGYFWEKALREAETPVVRVFDCAANVTVYEWTGAGVED